MEKVREGRSSEEERVKHSSGDFELGIDRYNWEASQVAQWIKNLPANAGDARDVGSIPGLGMRALVSKP